MAKVRLIENPFSRDGKTLAFPDFGTTLQDLYDSLEMSESLKKDLIIQKMSDTLEEYETIPPEDYATTFLKEDDNYLVMVKLRGSGSGGKILRSVAMIAIMAFAGWAAPIIGGWAGAQAGMAGIGMYGPVVGTSAFAGGAAMIATSASVLAYAGIVGAGMALMNAIVPLPGLDTGDMSYQAPRTLSGSSNQQSPYSPVPRIYGKTRFSPYKVAPDYTEVLGDDTYMRCLFCFGYGPLKISDIKVGTNDISGYQEVEYEIREGWMDDEPLTLYKDGVKSQSYSVNLYGIPEYVITTLDQQEEVSLDVNFPYGVYRIRPNSGEVASNPTRIIIKYRELGDEEWIDFGTYDYPYKEKSSFIKSYHINFPKKSTYQISLRQEMYGDNYGHDGQNGFAAAYLTTVRNIVEGVKAVNAPGFALMAVRIKATDQLNGTLDNVSALCESYENKFRYIDEESVFCGSLSNTTDKEEISVNIKKGEEVKIEVNFYEGYNFNPELLGGDLSRIRISYGIKLLSNGESLLPDSGWTPGGFITDNVSLLNEDFQSPFKFYINLDKTFGYYNYLLNADSLIIKAQEITLYWEDDMGFYESVIFNLNEENESYPSFSNFNYIRKLDESVLKKDITLNRHPAWHVYDLLTGTASEETVTDDMIDINSLMEWEEHYPNWIVDKAIDGSFTKLDVIRSMCSAGKAFFTNINGKYTVVIDKVGKEPVAAISSRNSFGFEMTKSFQKDIHAFKVKYIETELDWSEQEVIVYNSGYDETNASVFEGIESYGCTDRERAWKFGKYMLGQYTLRPEKYAVSQDVENIIVNTGDVVLLYSDVIKVGLGSARIKEIFLDDADRVAGIMLDDKFYLPSGDLYSICIRDSFGKLETYGINPNQDESDIIEFSTPIPKSLSPEFGNQVFLGIVERENLRCIVQSKVPGPDYTASISLVSEAPEIHDESTDDMPPYDPKLTQMPLFPYTSPMKPVISNIISDERALAISSNGTAEEGVSFLVQPQEGERVSITGIQVLASVQESPINHRHNFIFSGNDTIRIPLPGSTDNMAFIAVRFVSENNIVSPWEIFPIVIEGKKRPPPDILNLDRQGDNITWNYPNKSLDFSGFRVYYNLGINYNKNEALKAHSESLITSPPFSTSELPKGDITLFVVAVDDIGNESSIPAMIAFNNGYVEYDNILEVIDIKESGFVGRRVNMDIDGDNLSTIKSDIFYSSDNSLFYEDDNSLFYTNGTYGDSYFSFQINNTNDSSNAFVKLDWDVIGNHKVTYRRESKEEFYPPVEDNFYPDEYDFFYDQSEFWYPMPSKLLIGQETVTFKIQFESVSTKSTISKLIATIDSPDVSEMLSNISVPIGGKRLPITKNFKVINKVFLTLVNSNSAMSVEVLDYDITGPLIQAYDKNGEPVSCVVNADVRGYI